MDGIRRGRMIMGISGPFVSTESGHDQCNNEDGKGKGNTVLKQEEDAKGEVGEREKEVINVRLSRWLYYTLRLMTL